MKFNTDQFKQDQYIICLSSFTTKFLSNKGDWKGRDLLQDVMMSSGSLQMPWMSKQDVW